MLELFQPSNCVPDLHFNQRWHIATVRRFHLMCMRGIVYHLYHSLRNMLGCISIKYLNRELFNENVALHLQLNPVLEKWRDQGRRGEGV